ncbi:cell division protein SepF [Brevibacterium sp. UMB1308A]|uniref:cell division protein SepF n=1 Tax=Brevibacterium sp. UMB1308A TaxID=3050608 RepID=UPI00254B0681|nr:cell division protein SepF [Brevibacterium sp. UMB1308A]MDK8346434.1 cell division protein SepF [Brevibacterium sp. UMB1308B]MDK8713315.1 cell division protein SepF [Brevibacterium sp. UMB1308A]
MSTLKKISNYFGFGEEEAYDTEPRHERNSQYEASEYEAPVYEEEEQEEPADVTPIRSSVRPVETASPANMSNIHVIHPRSYNDAKAIGTAFRDGIPVVMNLTAMDEANAKRLVDFSAGLIFGLHGSISKVTNNVFLLTPANVEVGEETDSVAKTQASFFNQS